MKKLDLISVMKALQTFSQELILENLFGKLMEIALEYTATQKVGLILETEGQLCLVAQGEIAESSEFQTTENIITVGQPLPLELAAWPSALIIFYVIRTQTRLLLPDAAHEGLFVNDSIDWQQPLSILAIPLLYQSNLIGVLYLENNSRNDAFSTDSVQFLETLATQVALSVANARLYADLASANDNLKRTTAKLEDYNRMLESRVIERTKRLETMATLSEHLNAILDTQQLLAELVNQIKEKFNYYHVHVYLLDESGQSLVMVAGSGEVGAIMKAQGHTIPMEALKSLVVRAVRSREIVNVDNVQQALDWLPNPLLPNTACEMAIPLIAEGRVLGVLDVQADKVAGLDDSDANLLRSLANQIAIALNNAWFFEQTQTALAEAEELYLISQEMVAAADISGLVEVVVEGIAIPSINRAVLFTFSYDSEGNIDTVTVQGNWYSGEGETPTGLGESYLRDGNRPFFLPDVLLSPNPEFFNDIQQHQLEQRLVTLGRRLNVRALAVLPLRSRAHQIGVLLLEGEQAITFQEREVRLCLALSGQLSVSVENRLLFDQTQRWAAELVEAKESLTKLNADKDKFFSIVAHDLKGPFQPLLGMSELLPMMADDLKPDDIREMGETIYRAAKNVFNLLENLLQWSRLEMGRMVCEPIQVNLHQLVEETVGLLSTNANDKEIILQNKVAANLWAFADVSMLSTVIRNLTSNALKFTPRGGTITISACHFQSENQLADPSPGLFEISVADTGVGISPVDMEKLFKLEVHHTTLGTAKEQGTGLGLIICQEMVEKNGGHIWVESESGKGTVFKFTVPGY